MSSLNYLGPSKQGIYRKTILNVVVNFGAFNLTHRINLFKIFYICFLALVVACEAEIDNNIRVLVTGTVVDYDNNPIDGARVEVYADEGPSVSGAILGEGFSDASGNFDIISLFGPNEFFNITVSLNSNYSNYEYRTNTSEYTPDGLMFELNTVRLSEVSRFNLNIIKESTGDIEFDFSVTYIQPICFEVFEQGVIVEGQSTCFPEATFSRTLNIDAPEANRQILVPLNSTLMFTYSLDGGEETQQLITVNSANYVFEFSY